MRRKLAKARRLTEIENRFSENFLQGMVGGIYYLLETNSTTFCNLIIKNVHLHHFADPETRTKDIYRCNKNSKKKIRITLGQLR